MFQCARCGGSGKTAWKHVEDGVCFACDGTGKVDIEPKTIRAPEFKKRSHADAVAYLRVLYRNAKNNGSTYEDMVEAATGIAELFTIAPEIKPHFAALGWEV